LTLLERLSRKERLAGLLALVQRSRRWLRRVRALRETALHHREEDPERVAINKHNRQTSVIDPGDAVAGLDRHLTRIKAGRGDLHRCRAGGLTAGR
jgi:hypothetical protein